MRMSGIRKSFGDLLVLDGFGADFPESSVTAILGPSGCGKTTLLNIAAGLISPDSGEIEGFSASTFSYAFQEPRLLPWSSARDNILFALSGLSDRKLTAERTDRYLAAAELAPFADSRPSGLSGGMRQRLSLARAFAFPSEVLLLDEAFSSVDLKIRIDLMDLFSRLWEEERRTTLMVTHDIQEAVYLADRVLVLSPRPARLIADVPLRTARATRRFGSSEEREAESRLYDLVLRG